MSETPHIPRAIDLLLRRRWSFLVGVLGLTVLLGFAAARLEFSTSPESILDSNYGEFSRLREHERVLGSFEHRILLVLTSRDVFAPANLAKIRAAGDRLESLATVVRVRSLVRAGFPLPSPEEEPAAFKKAVKKSRLLTPFLVSADGRRAALHVDLAPWADLPANRDETIKEVAAVARATGLEPLLAGVPLVRQAYANYIRADLFLLPPLVGLILTGLLALTLRRLTSVLALLLVVFLAAVWTVGLMSLTGGRVTALTAILPSLIMVIGIATGVHVVARNREALERGASPRDAAREAMLDMLLPCGLTALTTAVGFSSLAIARIPDVREFGLYSAAGALFSFLLGVPLIGVLLSFGRGLGSVRVARGNTLLVFLSRALRNRPRIGVAVGILLVVVSVAGLPRLESNTYLLEDVRRGEPIYEATRAADSDLGGVIGFDVVLSRREGILDAEVVRWTRALERDLRAMPGVKAVVGPGTLIEESARVAGIADVKDAAAGFILAAVRQRGGKDAVASLVTEDGRLGRVVVRTGDIGSTRSGELRREALARASEGLPEGLEVRIAGLTVLAEELLGRLVREMGKSTVVAFAVIFVMISVLFRSLRIGALAMVPNLLPLLCAAGFMGFAGITIRSSIALIFAVALGIAVDDTIHILSRYRRERASGADVRRAVGQSVLRTGRPVVLTSAVLCAGFLAFLLSGFKATEQFGLISAVTIATALLGDLVVLPAILLLGRSDPVSPRPGRRDEGTLSG